MRLQTLATALVTASAALAGVVNLNIYTDGEEGEVSAHPSEQVVIAASSVDKKKKDQPAWRTRDDAHIVPLHPSARTGSLPAAVEEGLIAAIGPRFANEFISAAAEADANGGYTPADSCPFLKCASTVVQAMPCIVAAVKCKCVEPMKNCAVTKADICGCASCTGPLEPAVNDFCSSSNEAGNVSYKQESDSLGYAEYIAFSQNDPKLQGFRGDLRQAALDEAKALASDGVLAPSNIHAMDVCGCPNACVGLCVFGSCLGGCV